MNAEGFPKVLEAEYSKGHGRPFFIVSYYTPENGYGELIKKLRASCQTFALDYYFEKIESLGSWQLNIHYRPQFLLKALAILNRDLVWIDADGIIKQYPALFEALAIRDDFEIGVHFFKGRELLGGTMYIPNRPRTRTLIEMWANYDAHRLQFKEQRNLQDLVEGTGPGAFRVCKLPAEYVKIFDLMKDLAGPAVIEHYQASRRLRSQRPGGVRGGRGRG